MKIHLAMSVISVVEYPVSLHSTAMRILSWDHGLLAIGKYHHLLEIKWPYVSLYSTESSFTPVDPCHWEYYPHSLMAVWVLKYKLYGHPKRKDRKITIRSTDKCLKKKSESYLHLNHCTPYLHLIKGYKWAEQTFQKYPGLSSRHMEGTKKEKNSMKSVTKQPWWHWLGDF